MGWEEGRQIEEVTAERLRQREGSRTPEFCLRKRVKVGYE